MKKKSFKKLFLLMFIPCILFINGCGKDDNKNSQEKQLVNDYKEVNEVLSSLKQKKSTLKQFKINGNYKNSYIDLENGGKVVGYDKLPWDTKYVKGSIDYQNEKYALKYHNKDETRYDIYYVQNENGQYVGYTKSHYATGEEKNLTSFLISKDLIANELSFVGEVGVNLNKLNCENYESMQNSFNLLIKEDISRFSWIYNFNLELNPLINLYKENDSYIFDYKLTVNVEEEIFVVDSYVKFNSDSISEYKYFHSLETPYAYKAEEVNLYYSNGVDNSLYLTDFSRFVDEPIIDTFKVTVVVEGYVVNTIPSGSLASGNLKYTPGEKYTYNFSLAEGLIFDGWYLDPEYKVKLDTLEECPSYDIIIYGKVRAKNPNDTVVVTTTFVEQRYGEDFHVKFKSVEKGSEYLFNFGELSQRKTIYYSKHDYCYLKNIMVNGSEFAQESFIVADNRYYILIKGEAIFKI